MLMMVLPLKAKWIAVFEAVIYVYDLPGKHFTKAEIFVCMIHMCNFFLWMVFAGRRAISRSGASRILKRRCGLRLR